MKYSIRVVLFAVLGIILASTWGWCIPTVTKEFTLPNFEGSPFRPRICGDWVVDVQNVDDKACASTSIGIIVYNIPTGKAYMVFEGAAGWCSMGSTLAAWTGKSVAKIEGFCNLKGDRSGSDNPSNLILIDVTTWRYYTPPLSTGPAFAPVVWSNYVAYEGKNGQIYLIDMYTGQQKQISQADKNNGPQIGQDLVVWQEFTDKQQIRGYRISTGEFIKITDDSGEEHRSPYTDGKTVVWWDKGVTAYDVATRQRTKISDTGYYPDVDNGIVVYMKSSAVYAYDLVEQKEFRISKGNSNCGPSIDGNRVIWTWKNDIYCAELDRSGKLNAAK